MSVVALRQPKVFVVEDDAATRGLIAAYLADNGMDVVEIESGAAFLGLIARQSPSMVLMDISLPDADGMTLAQELRGRSNAGLIFITARDNEIDRVAGLEMGGDDYVVNPVNLRELLARVRSVLRRRNTTPASFGELRRFGDFTIDLVRRELSDGAGALVPLTPGEFNCLSALVMGDGRPISRDYLLDAIGPRRSDPTDRTVDTIICRLRNKLEPDPRRPTIILTVQGLGYKLGVGSLPQ